MQTASFYLFIYFLAGVAVSLITTADWKYEAILFHPLHQQRHQNNRSVVMGVHELQYSDNASTSSSIL